MSLYREFIAMVEEIESIVAEVGVHDFVDTVPISKNHLFAVKNFVKSELERRSRGGRNSAGKSGRKIQYTDEKHIKRREAMRRYRASLRSKNEHGQ